MQARVIWEWYLRRRTLIFCDHLYTARFASRIGANHILWAHLIEFDQPLDEMHRRSLERSSAIICNSEYTRRHISQLHPSAKDKLRVVKLGDHLRPTLDQPLYLQNIGRCQLAMIGRMDAAERYKGHDQVLEALPVVLQRFPQCRLVIAGGGSDAARLRDKANRLGLATAVEFTASIGDNQVMDLVRSSSALLLPSLREGFGLVYLHALWAGLPAVAIKGTVAEEVLGECGVYCDSQTPDAIAAAINLILAGQWKAARESQLRYNKNFSFESFEQRLREFITNELPRLS